MSKLGSLSRSSGASVEPFTGEYVGERLSDGRRDGLGREVYPNRDQYEGEHRQDLRNGRGCYMYVSGARYTGDWKKGCKHGHGKFNYPDGSEYCGEWRHNKKHGFGKYTYRNGDIYEGAWRENVKNGLGTYVFREVPVTYRGAWVDGVLRGPITISYPNYEYHGHFNGAHPIGEGAFTFRMKYMLPGHIEMYANAEVSASISEKRERPSTASSISGFGSVKDEWRKESTVETAPRCLPRFIAHGIRPYEEAHLPQQPIHPPDSHSSLTSTCTDNSSCEDIQLYQVQSPTLISADPAQYDCGEDDDELCISSQSDDAECSSP